MGPGNGAVRVYDQVGQRSDRGLLLIEDLVPFLWLRVNRVNPEAGIQRIG
jgi:hypothetical protein